MKNKKPDTQPLMLTEGYFSDELYANYEMLIQKGVKNWRQSCPYQLASNGLSGRYQIIQLCSMQIGYGDRKGAAMFNVFPAKDSLSVVVVKTCESKGCFNRIKFIGGDIFFFDDSHPHNLITDGAIEYVVFTIRKSVLPVELAQISKLINHNIVDSDAHLIGTLHEIRKRFSDDTVKKDTESYQAIENKILTVLTGLLSEQIPVIPKLTAGEKIALEIREQIFGHMDGKMSISSLAKEYNISEKTLQTSFKSLFGYTPKRFFRLLKLNLVHHELMESTPKQTSVIKVANKWGFMHMGHFTAFYTELFGENPSQTLKTILFQEGDILASCVERQEEMH